MRDVTQTTTTDEAYGAGGELVAADVITESHKFTGKERDSETGNDYFGARYYPNNLGRFLTPDPLMASARASNPQTWNRYAYTLNNPLRFIDPDGLQEQPCATTDQECAKKRMASNGKGRLVVTSGIVIVVTGNNDNPSWWKKSLGYFYAKHGNGTGLGVKFTLGPVKGEAILKKGEETKFTTGGSTTSSVHDAGVKLGVLGVKAGVSVETTQVTMENGTPVDRPSVTEIVPGVKLGKFEGSNSEVGVGIGGCAIFCSELSVGIQADKVLNDIGNAAEKAISNISDAVGEAISD